MNGRCSLCRVAKVQQGSIMRIHPALVVALVLAGVGAPAAAQTDPLALRYAQTGSTWRSVFSMPMRVAVKQGYFAKHGLKFTMVPIEAGAEESLVAHKEDKADVAHVATSFLDRKSTRLNSSH